MSSRKRFQQRSRLRKKLKKAGLLSSPITAASSPNIRDYLKTSSKRHPLITTVFIILGILAMLSFSGIGWLITRGGNQSSNPSAIEKESFPPTPTATPSLSASPTLTPSPVNQ